MLEIDTSASERNYISIFMDVNRLLEYMIQKKTIFAKLITLEHIADSASMPLTHLWDSDSHPTSEEGAFSRSLGYATGPYP
jgi:hypothetical protein